MEEKDSINKINLPSDNKESINKENKDDEKFLFNLKEGKLQIYL